MAAGSHPFPSRTRQLSPPAPMIVGPQGPSKVGRRQILSKPRARRNHATGFCVFRRRASMGGSGAMLACDSIAQPLPTDGAHCAVGVALPVGARRAPPAPSARDGERRRAASRKAQRPGGNKAALALLDRYLTQHPGDARALVDRGDVYEALGDERVGDRRLHRGDRSQSRVRLRVRFALRVALGDRAESRRAGGLRQSRSNSNPEDGVTRCGSARWWNSISTTPTRPSRDAERAVELEPDATRQPVDALPRPSAGRRLRRSDQRLRRLHRAGRHAGPRRISIEDARRSG